MTYDLALKSDRPPKTNSDSMEKSLLVVVARYEFKAVMLHINIRAIRCFYGQMSN